MGAARAAFMLPENVPQKHSKPRASGIGNCARQQAYSMAGADTEPGTGNSGNLDGDITTEQGRIMDAQITQKLITANDLVLQNTQISLPSDFPMTGHPDGELGAVTEAGQAKLQGLKWGYEHKQLGRWAYEKVFKEGFEQGEPGYLCQTVSYGMGLGWDVAYIVAMAQDASSTRSDARTNLKSKNPKVRWANQPDWDPKMLVYAVDLRPYYDTLGKRLLQRAEWLTDWYNAGADPAQVKREANPNTNARDEYLVSATGEITRVEGQPFPCGWCPWLARCQRDGEGAMVAPELPFKLMDEDED